MGSRLLTSNSFTSTFRLSMTGGAFKSLGFSQSVSPMTSLSLARFLSGDVGGDGLSLRLRFVDGPATGEHGLRLPGDILVARPIVSGLRTISVSHSKSMEVWM